MEQHNAIISDLLNATNKCEKYPYASKEDIEDILEAKLPMKDEKIFIDFDMMKLDEEHENYKENKAALVKDKSLYSKLMLIFIKVIINFFLGIFF